MKQKGIQGDLHATGNESKAESRFKMYSFLLLAVVAIISSIFVYYLYLSTRSILQERLKERLLSITKTASLLFSPEEVNSLVEFGSKSLGTREYSNTVKILQEIKRVNSDVTYAYIFARTEDPRYLKYVADADVYVLKPELYFNEDKVVEEGLPGTLYDASEVHSLNSGVAFERPTADEDPFMDEKWGVLYSAYAPIEGTDTIIGVDVSIQDFQRLINTLFVPFGLFIVVLLSLLVVLTISLVKMWESRIGLLKELDRQKDELISIVSHQLNTPVTSVKWNLEMMLDGDMGQVNEEQKKQLETMQSVTTDLADLVAMMLDVSRIQLGRMKVDRAEVDLSAFFKEILLVIDPKAEQKHQKLVKNIPAHLPTAMLDRRLMRMTLENLLANAVKYTPEGGTVTLDVKVKDDRLRYEVRDTGYGIPKAEQGKIFGKLFRASNIQSQDGNGLGLFAAKGAVEAQGGTIRFESEVGKGTTFFVELPIEVPAKEFRQK
jgi:signal transduction histidine kinase